jgi:crotonobetainyl-CoA:carnitine CoA-transferase CaiB-like acyl-CoA transferase
MADYGAEVIKVEPPGGDPFRFQPAWISWNRGKKGIVLDLSTQQAASRPQLAARLMCWSVLPSRRHG